MIRQRVRTGRTTYVIGKVRTDPTRKDTDRDGLNDGDEVSGRLNRRHGRHASDPTNFDTDFGRVTDGREVRAGSDPSDSKSYPRKP